MTIRLFVRDFETYQHRQNDFLLTKPTSKIKDVFNEGSGIQALVALGLLHFSKVLEARGSSLDEWKSHRQEQSGKEDQLTH